MSKPRESEIVVTLLTVVFEVGQLILTISMGSIAGYMVIGGFVGMGLMLAGAKNLIPWATSIGWGLGAIAGGGTQIAQWRRGKGKKKPFRTNMRGKADSGRKAQPSEFKSMVFRIPSLGGWLKSIALGGFFGGIGGVAASLFLTVILISVTTSPFVPTSWRPETHAPEDDDDHVRTRRRDGVSTSFTHPLLSPLWLYTFGSLATIGLVGGAVFGFFDEQDKSSVSA